MIGIGSGEEERMEEMRKGPHAQVRGVELEGIDSAFFEC